MSAMLCAYWSRAAAWLDDADVAAIVATSRARNAASGVSSMLLHSGRCFFQVIEGSVASVEGTFARIATDARHRRVIRLLAVPVERGCSGGQPMASAQVSDPTILVLAEEDDLGVASSALSSVADRDARVLLTRFLQARWRTQARRSPAPR